MIDSLDKQILNQLGMNCRISYQEIADKFRISATVVKKKVEKLIDSGVISEFIVEFNLAMIDGEFYLALIHTDATANEDAFIETLGSYHMVSEVGALAGGMFIVFGSYRGSNGLLELEKFLRSHKSVTNVDIHTLLFIRGKKISLKKLHLRVLRHLLYNPRMAATKIAKKTGISTRTVSRAIDEILESEAIRLSIRWNLNTTDSISFLSQIQWDEKKIDMDGVWSWLRKTFPVEFWEPLISATAPTMFPVFVVNSLKDAELITRKLQAQNFITSVVTLIGKSSRTFYDLRRYELEKMIKEAPLL